MVYTCCMLDKQGYMHVHSWTHPQGRIPTRTHTHARMHTQINTYPRQQWFAKAPQYYVISRMSVLFIYLLITCYKAVYWYKIFPQILYRFMERMWYFGTRQKFYSRENVVVYSATLCGLQVLTSLRCSEKLCKISTDLQTLSRKLLSFVTFTDISSALFATS